MLSNNNWTPDPAVGHLLYTFRRTENFQNSSLAGKEICSNGDPENDFVFLENVLQSKELNALVKAHNVILFTNQEQCPFVSNASYIAGDVMEDIRPLSYLTEDLRELTSLLNLPHIRSLLLSHDSIAQRDYIPKLDPIHFEVDEDEGSMKIVQLIKSQESTTNEQSSEPIVGATIKAEDCTGRILIARVMHGGAADRSGLISVGDEIIEVNGINVEGKSPNDVLQILQSAQSTITFKLIPNENRPIFRESRIRLRAQFNYNPEDDKYIPCKEAGLPFLQGDIIHIVSQDDPYWWQARREVDKNMRAGLIPSRLLQERRLLQEKNENQSEIDVNRFEAFTSVDETSRIYEEVTRIFPQPGVYRPIILIGPSGVGRNELKRRIIALDVERHRATVPHTSRPKKPDEVHGVDYYFSSHEQMTKDIQNDKFIEHGEYRGNLYGTSTDGILNLLQEGYQPIICPNYQALKMLRTSELKPFIIFIKPPSFERLKETRQGSKINLEEVSSRVFTDEELQIIIEYGSTIERDYGHWIDCTVVNDDLNEAFENIVKTIHRLDQDAQWVPVSWAQSVLSS